MKLGFHYHIPVYNLSEEIFLPGYLGLFIDELAKNVEVLYLIAYTTPQANPNQNDYQLKSRNIVLIDMRMKKPFAYRILFGKNTIKKIYENLSCDIILVRAPSPLAPYFFRFNKKGIRVAYLLVGDYVKSAWTLNTPFLKKMLSVLLFKYNDILQNKVIKESLTFVNSEMLYLQYEKIVPNLEKTKTTTLSQSDFYFREDTCLKETINILYTGRFDLGKGMEELIFAVRSIHDINIKIHFVGWEWNDNPNKPVETYLKKKAQDLNVDVTFHGKKKIGTELNAMYRMADIYALPSYQEGFPRTIWEAMANSIPVITTKVGSIPLYLKDKVNALLIEPKNVEQLKDAIEILIHDSELRKELLRNAYQLVQNNTVEYQTKLIVDKINNQ